MGLEQKQRMKDFAWQVSILTGDAKTRLMLSFSFSCYLGILSLVE